MTNEQTIYGELVEKIEELAPDAGFWMKGKPLDFTLDEVLLAIIVHSQLVIRLIPSILGDPVVVITTSLSTGTITNENSAPFILGKPLSEQSPETKAFLLSLLK